MAVSAFQLVLLIAVLSSAASTGGHALKVVNKATSPLTVYVPPICKPCNCPIIYCIRAPCPQNCPCPVKCTVGQPCPPATDCLCPDLCVLIPGVVVKVGASATLNVDYVAFPLAFFSVEVNGVDYNAKAGAGLEIITRTSIVVVTGKPCIVPTPDKPAGIEALVYPGPTTSSSPALICLVLGQRYGS